MLNYKWSKIKTVAHFMLLYKIIFVCCVTAHSIKPGKRILLYILLAFGISFDIFELLIFKDSEFKLDYIDKIAILVIYLVLHYCIQTLY